MKNIKNSLIIIGFILISNFANSQTIYEQWKWSHKQNWDKDLGLTLGLNSGIDVQFYKFYHNSKLYMKKKVGINFGMYYEGVLFNPVIQEKFNEWNEGGIRGSLHLLVYPYSSPNNNRFYLGIGLESGTRNINGIGIFDSDISGIFGYEMSFYKSLKVPILIRISGRYTQSLTSDFYYFLPCFTIGIGK